MFVVLLMITAYQLLAIIEWTSTLVVHVVIGNIPSLRIVDAGMDSIWGARPLPSISVANHHRTKSGHTFGLMPVGS